MVFRFVETRIRATRFVQRWEQERKNLSQTRAKSVDRSKATVPANISL
jgi:hypothetical protein